MSTVARLASFGLALAVLFGGAVAVGSAIGPQRDNTASAAQGTHGSEMGATGDAHAAGETKPDGEHGAMPAQSVRGLAVSDNGLTLELARTTAAAGKRFDLAFRVVDREGETVRDFDLEHTKRMHFIVVRRDMTGFQHLHPAMDADGTWTVPVTLPDAGVYRAFADFSVDGSAHTLAADVTVDGAVRSRALPQPVEAVTVDGLRISLKQIAGRPGAEAELFFDVTRDGRPVAVEDYLGAKGHVVALRQGDLAFLHVHPDENSLRFMATFPSAGSYRLFLQFQTEGRVHTAAFTQEVTR
jgi:hypothetical protein